MRKVTFTLIIPIILAFLFPSTASAAPVISNGSRILIGKQVEILNDSLNKLSAQEAAHSNAYYQSKVNTPNFDISKSTYWIKFTIKNETQQNLLLEVDNALIDTSNLYVLRNGEPVLFQAYGAAKVYDDRKYKYPGFVYDLSVPFDSTYTYILKIRSSEQLLVPMIVSSSQALAEDQNTRDIISGIHMGVLLIMIFYNLFVFLSVKDRSYLYYVLYIFFIGLAQITLTGYSYKYLFPDSPALFNDSIVVSSSLAGLFAIGFIRTFLHTKKQTPVLDKMLLVFAGFYIIAGILRLAGLDQISSRAVDVCALGASAVVYAVTIKLSLRNYRPAKFFLIAWTLFIVGLILFVLRNLNILPYSNFTNYTMQVGTVLEVALLSIALADKINQFKKEKEDSQVQALEAAQENARIIREQNLILETKVKERTMELTASNTELNKTLIDLKEAESQLVESEKMASLGQLTAGIAHEINNPINFVTSNVNPLRRDVEMLLEAVDTIENIGLSEDPVHSKKQQINEFKEDIDFDYLKVEIAHLLKGINEGASRTAEIVKGLRIFSRLDEDDLKKADVNEGIDSTMVIVNNLLNNKIKVEKEYGNLPLIECYPGKLNQVYLNIISNAIHAIHKRWGDAGGGVLKISTSCNEKSVFVKIEDNGTGMDESTKKKIFEPFFTTKEVGEGTGLGMSIVYNTVKKHNGQIYVNSTVGVGTEFILDIPIIHEIL